MEPFFQVKKAKQILSTPVSDLRFKVKCPQKRQPNKHVQYRNEMKAINYRGVSVKSKNSSNPFGYFPDEIRPYTLLDKFIQRRRS